MRLKIALILIVLTLFGAKAAPVFGQSSGKSKPAPANEEVSPAPKNQFEGGVTTGLKTRMFEVQHRDPQALVQAISGLTSGERGSGANFNREFKTITVRDLPENLAVIEKAIARLDQPEKTPPSLEVQIHLIAASRASTEKGNLPSGLEPVIAQLQSAFQFGGYKYMTTFVHRVKNGGDIDASGSTNPPFSNVAGARQATYAYRLQDIKLTPDPSGSESIQMKEFIFNMGTLGGDERLGARITTELSMREGEMVVVGTANVGSSNDAIIVVISIKKTK